MIDRYRMSKQAVDEYLANHRKQARPMVNIDAIVVAFVVAVVALLAVYLLGFSNGQAEPVVTEYQSPQTKCIKWDFGGQDGQKRCYVWKRVA